ncbi:MAG: GNAT family N-acetyltransferase [Bacteroidota bacterium]
MDDSKLYIEEIKETKDIPFDLLELADPSRPQINKYVKTGKCYIGKVNAKIKGVFVLHEISSTNIEVKNIAVRESEQGKGLGKALLRHAQIISLELGYKTMTIGTGNSSIGQLALYQKMGFEIARIDKNFFLRNYREPIFEHGIQCKHMIVLEKRLDDEKPITLT